LLDFETPPPPLHIPTIIEFATDVLGLTLTVGQTVGLKALEGLALTTPEEEAMWATISGGRPYVEGRRYRDAAYVMGAGSGKTGIVATVLVLYEAFYFTERNAGHHLLPGQVPLALWMAQNIQGAKIGLNYLRGAITNTPELLAQTEHIGENEITLHNGVVIRVLPCTVRAPRGESILVAVLDEFSFFRFETAVESDVEILASIRRGLRLPGSRILKVSTPFLMEGQLWKDHQRAFGKDISSLLVLQAGTLTMYPPAAESVAADQATWDEDPGKYQREIEAQFVEVATTGFVTREQVEACAVLLVGDQPYSARHLYIAAVDTTGLSTSPDADEWCFAVLHLEADTQQVMVDAFRAYKGNVDPDVIIAEQAALTKAYGLTQVVGDHYGAQVMASLYRAHGVGYVMQPWEKSESYAITGRLIRRAPDSPGLRLVMQADEIAIRQFSRLQMTAREGGSYRIDHRRNQHDDRSNVIALAASILSHHANAQQAQAVRQEEGEQYASESEIIWDPRRWRARDREALYQRLDGLVQRAVVAGWNKDNLDKLVAEAGQHLGKISTLSETIADKLNEAGHDSLAERMRRGGIR
jgi:hypothetical protein